VTTRTKPLFGNGRNGRQGWIQTKGVVFFIAFVTQQEFGLFMFSKANTTRTKDTDGNGNIILAEIAPHETRWLLLDAILIIIVVVIVTIIVIIISILLVRTRLFLSLSERDVVVGIVVVGRSRRVVVVILLGRRRQLYWEREPFGSLVGLPFRVRAVLWII
jgi:hypothetical protein